MDSEILMERAENELFLSLKLKSMSDDDHLRDYMEIPQEMTFYSATISHAYYAIFYSAQAMLLTKNIKVVSPDIHRKTIDAFKEYFVDSGILDVKLLNIYKRLLIRAGYLLHIFRLEKQKRGDFTYKTLPQADKEPAEDSIKNAMVFVSNIKKSMDSNT